MVDFTRKIESGQPYGLYDILRDLQVSANFGQDGLVRYVDANAGSDSNDGKSWATAWDTLTYALVKMDSERGGIEGFSSSRLGYCRHKLYIKGKFTEDLVRLIDKTDIIGVGSNSANSQCRIVGTHVIADDFSGTRIFNIESRDDGASANWTFPGGGFSFYNCWFRHMNLSETHGIYVTDPSQVNIVGNHFSEFHDTQYATAAIEIVTTVNAANVQCCNITGNRIHGVKGILVGEGVFSDCWIVDNFIQAETQPIDDNSVSNDATEGFFCINNRLFSEGAEDVSGMNIRRSSGNVYTSSTDTRGYPFVTTS